MATTIQISMQDVTESLLHMIVNFGESPTYPEKMRRLFLDLTKYFHNSEILAEAYLETAIDMEMHMHPEVYSSIQSIGAQAPVVLTELREMANELKETMRRHCTK